ncbi:MAG: histidine kinase [Prevotella sp.]
MKSVEDSITALSPCARTMIEKGLHEAKDSLTYYRYLACLAKYYALSSTPDSTHPCLDRVIAFAKSQSPSKRINGLLGYAYSCRANVYHNFHINPETVTQLYKKSHDLLMQSCSKDMLPDVCANLADAYIFRNDMPAAASWYRRALYLVDSLNLPKERNVSLLMGLGRIYISLGDYEQAHKYYRETEPYYRTMRPSMQAYFLNNYGNFYYFKKDYSSALEKFLLMKGVLERYGMQDNFDMYVCKLNMADVLLNLGRTDESLKYIEEVLPFFQRHNDETAIYYCNTVRMGIALKSDDVKTVREILANEKRPTTIDYNLVNIRYRYAREYYERVGNYEMAYRVLRRSIALTDSLSHNRISMRSAEIMERFTQDTIRLHHDVLIGQKNLQIERANLKETIFISLSIALGLLLVVWTVYSRKRILQDQIKIMQMKIASVSNRISPHFVFNVLNNRIMNADEKEATELTELSKLIRSNLDMSCRLSVTLKEELEFVKSYVRVERFLLGDDFTFELNVPEDFPLDSVYIPATFLQILAENSIKHALKGREGDKKLSISVSHVDDTTYIVVSDNGPGFDIRHRNTHTKTGLTVIAQMTAFVNARNKKKVRFNISNVLDADGKTKGCTASIAIPDNINMFPNN